MATKRPNILYIMADQMAAPLLSFHDKQSPIKTPNLDRLAGEGVVFENAYCNSPLCAPSRFVMVTGQLPSKIGAYDNAADLPADVPTYAHYLRAEGYHTALAGKMHFCGPDQLHGYEQRLTSDIYPGDYGWSVNWDEPVGTLLTCVEKRTAGLMEMCPDRKFDRTGTITCPPSWRPVPSCGLISSTLTRRSSTSPPNTCMITFASVATNPSA